MYKNYDDVTKVSKDFLKAFIYAETNYQQLVNDVKSKTAKVKYDVSSYGLGSSSPSLIEDVILRDMNREKQSSSTYVRSNIFTRFLYDNNDNLLLLQRRYNDAKDYHINCYVFYYENYWYYIWFKDDKIDYAEDHFRIKMGKEGVLTYETADPYNGYCEFYNYLNKFRGRVSCNVIWYNMPLVETAKAVLSGKIRDRDIPNASNSEVLRRIASLEVINDKPARFEPRREKEYIVLVDDKGHIIEVKSRYELDNHDDFVVNAQLKRSRDSKNIFSSILKSRSFSASKRDFSALWEAFKEFSNVAFDCVQDDLLWEVFCRKGVIEYHMARQFAHIGKKGKYSHTDKIDIYFEAGSSDSIFKETTWSKEYASTREFFAAIERRDAFRHAITETIRYIDIDFDSVR